MAMRSALLGRALLRPPSAASGLLLRRAAHGEARGSRWVPIYTVDAFSKGVFGGNPAGVVVLGGKARAGGVTTLDDATMQLIAREANLAETAFVSPAPGGGESDWSLRWFTPSCEVELCGHGTLGAAKCLYATGEVDAKTKIQFSTRVSGVLTVQHEEDDEGQPLLAMDFPADPPAGDVGCGALEGTKVLEGLGLEEEDVIWSGRSRFDIVVEIQPTSFVDKLEPDFGILKQVETRGVVVTARTFRRSLPAAMNIEIDEHVDFVSRFFGPRIGIDEDPVTGSAHCALGPYWAEKRNESEVAGYQASPRGGFVSVHCEGDRVKLRGHAALAMEGTMYLPTE